MTWDAFQGRLLRVQFPLRLTIVYVLCLIGFSFFTLLRYPIMLMDTDLWFHLDYGRYLFQHHVIPQATFFSFISPPIQIVDHPWLFQALVYLVHSFAGYFGLIVLRSVAYLAAVALIFRYFFKTLDRSQPAWWSAVIVALCDMLLFVRYLNIRPFIVSDLFIVGFLYLLELRPQRTAFLPLLAILWCNLHGIFYPVMVWICLSYSLEYIVQRLQGRISSREVRSFLVPLVLSMAAIYLTPHGLRLLPLPFLPLTYDAQYVSELSPVNLSRVLSLHITFLTPSAHSVFNVLLLAACLATIKAVWGRTLRISHFFLALGGWILLSKGERFLFEFVLLVLPLLKSYPPFRVNPLSTLAPKPLAVLTTALTMIMPMMFFRQVIPPHRPTYPVSSTDLPRGIDAFLNYLPARGAVFNHPDSGGYHRWMLDARYKIFTDMEFPGIPIEYFYLATHAFVEAETLRHVLERYNPSFITVPLRFRQFGDLIRQFPDYVMVFFDDAEVLYVNQKQYPNIAAQYLVKGFNPFQLGRKWPDQVLDYVDTDTFLPQLAQLIHLYPAAGFTNYAAATMFNRDDAYDRAIPYAETIIRSFPESPFGFWVLGDAWKGLNDDEKALSAYHKAWRRAEEGQRSRIGREMGAIYYAQHRYREAYKILAKSLDVFSPKVDLEDLYHFGVAAREAGKRREARAIFRYMHEFRLAPGDTEWLEKVKSELN